MDPTQDIHIHDREKPNKYVVGIILILAVLGIAYSFSRSTSKDVVLGKVVEITEERDTIVPVGSAQRKIIEQDLAVEIEEAGQNKIVNVLNDYKPVETGDEIYLRGSSFEENSFGMDTVSRSRQLMVLFVFFVLLVILTSGLKGINSLIGLAFTFAVIFTFMVPFILKGFSPILIGISGAAFILISTLYLSYGLNKKSISAFGGIIIALIFVGILSNYFVGVLNFTGISEASMYLDMVSVNSINLIGLMVAGIIIAAVGVLDDVAVIQSSLVFSLASSNSDLRGVKLFREAMRVGKDHISAVVNTLVLAYTGASLPLILILSLQKMPGNYFISLEIVAEEIARTLISSSGLLLAVPLTTLLAVLMAGKKTSVV